MYFHTLYSCQHWCLAYICEGISDLRIYVAVTCPYSQDWDVIYIDLDHLIFNGRYALLEMLFPLEVKLLSLWISIKWLNVFILAPLDWLTSCCQRGFWRQPPTLTSNSQLDESEYVKVETLRSLIQTGWMGDISQPLACLTMVIRQLSFSYKRL